VKTALQLVAIVFLLLHYPYAIDFIAGTAVVDANVVGTVLLYISVFFSLWSAWKYFAGVIHSVYRKDEQALEDERRRAAR
jgi:CDP-diacylglycerol--glycerol-3-phosphate 3-phosphatidyltransferase